MAKFSRTVGSSWQKTETSRSGKACFIHSHQLNIHFFLDQFTEIPTAYSSFLVYQFIVWTFTVVVSHYFLGTPRYGDIDVPIHRWLKKTISVASKPHLFQTARCVLGHSRLSFILYFFIEFLLFDDFHLLFLAK